MNFLISAKKKKNFETFLLCSVSGENRGCTWDLDPGKMLAFLICW